MSSRALRWSVVAALVLASLGLTGTRPTFAATLFGLIDTGELFSSPDNGATWVPLSTLPVSDAVGLAARLSSADLFLASRSGSIYRSLNSGLNWTGVGAITASDLEDLAIRPDGTLLALSATGSLYGSADFGASFTALAAITGSNFVSLCFTTPSVKYYALTRTGEVYESADNGASWVAKGAMPVSNARRIRAVQTSLHVLTETGDIFRSTDGGSNWTAVGTLSQIGMRGLVRNGNSLAAASREGHVATSADGASWTWQGSMNQLTLTALASNEPATTGVEPFAASGFRLGPPYPNPSRGAAAFSLLLEREDRVALALYDLAGRPVARRSAQHYAAGAHVVTWDPGVTRSGIYFARLESDGGASGVIRWVILN